MSRIVFAAKNSWTHEHTIICRQLFAGHMVGSRPMKRKKHLHRMIIPVVQKYSHSLYKLLAQAVAVPSFLCLQAMDDFLIIKYLGYFQELLLGSSLYLLELASPFEEVCSRWFCTLLFLCRITFPTFFRPPQHTSSFAVLADRLETGWDVRLLMRRLCDRWFVGAQI